MIDRNRRPGRTVSSCARTARRDRAPRPARVGELAPLEPRVMLCVTTIDPLVADHDHDVGGVELHVAPTVDPVLAAEYAATAEGADVFGAALAPLSDTFSLHSNPGATKTIYLDFTGHTTTGTWWNQAYGSSIVTPAFSLDSDFSSFSDTERERIQYIWQRVAEDFYPFDVDVTTQDPGSAALVNSGGADTQWGVRVAIGGSSFDWFGAGAGGVAYVGSFTLNSDTPTFVFTEQLGAGHEKYTAEAISHEVGHTLGLSHDGTSSSGYYGGHGSGETGWAPLMGVGYYQNLTQWSKGDYADASQSQDDLAIITTQNGFGYRPDDHAAALSSASTLGVSGSAVSDFGIIERNSDADVFAFNTAAGTIELFATPFDRGPNLDIRLELLNASGQTIAASNPTESLSASISANVAAGTYYLRVTGVGKGDPLSTGYTDYGSLGQYFLSGSIIDSGTQPPPPPPPPPAEITVSVADASADERDLITKGRNSGDPQISTMTFTVTLSAAASSTVTVNFATASGSATAGADYVATSGQLVFVAGVTSMTVTVDILGDTAVEDDETFPLNLTNLSGATLADGSAVGAIADNDTSGGDSGGGGNPGKGNGKNKASPFSAATLDANGDGRPDETVRLRIAQFLSDATADRPAKAKSGLTTAADAVLRALDAATAPVSVFDAV